MAENSSEIPGFAKNSDIMLAVGVIGVLIIMIIPLPPVMLDIFLAFSITSSLIILMVAIYMKETLEFSVFPPLLLIITLYRLSLNIASTRLILLHGGEGIGAAGQVIQSFGNFVVGGNYVVGGIVFFILVLINFIVITKGSVRTSEVAARFTLDAIPGKQMSIDADLNAGLIDDVEAKNRRRKLEQEADFYGSMDGAIRFVRGDAIAGIIITLINVLGGFIIGVFFENMTLAEAAKVYSLLTIGDGLVAQIPALIISTASGIVVTRASSDVNLGTDISRQLLFQPKAFAIASTVLFFFAMMPGLPTFAFLMLSIITGTIAYVTIKSQKAAELDKVKEEEKIAAAPVSERVETILPLDKMELEVGYELIPLVDSEKDGELLERIKSIRRQFALEFGIIVPPLHIRDNLQLKPSQYAILIKGVEVAKGEVMMGHHLAMNPGIEGKSEIKGIPTKEPTFGLPAIWITEEEKGQAQIAGFTVVDVATVITTHLKEIIKTHAHELIGRQEVQLLLDNLKETHPKVVEELIPAVLPLGTVVKVLQNLLREQISVRDFLTILEILADQGVTTKNPEILTEYVRQAMSRPISKQFVSDEGSLSVITLAQNVEDVLSNAVQRTDHGSYLSIDPGTAEKILLNIKSAYEKVSLVEGQPVILSSPSVRLHLRKLLERFIPNVVVLSHNEIAPNVQIKNIGMVTL